MARPCPAQVAHPEVVGGLHLAGPQLFDAYVGDAEGTSGKLRAGKDGTLLYDCADRAVLVPADGRAGKGRDVGQLQTAPLSVGFPSFRLIF